MGIDFQITAHLDQQVVTDLLLPILKSGEFFAEIKTPVASFSLVAHELANDLLPPGEPPYPAFKFRALHGTMFGHFCPTVKTGCGVETRRVQQRRKDSSGTLSKTRKGGGFGLVGQLVGLYAAKCHR